MFIAAKVQDLAVGELGKLLKSLKIRFALEFDGAAHVLHQAAGPPFLNQF